jgi:hypothetical protein
MNSMLVEDSGSVLIVRHETLRLREAVKHLLSSSELISDLIEGGSGSIDPRVTSDLCKRRSVDRFKLQHG